MDAGIAIARFLLVVAALPLAFHGITILYLMASMVVGSLLAALWVIIEDARG